MFVEIEVRVTDDKGRHTSEKTSRSGDLNLPIFRHRLIQDTQSMIERSRNGFNYDFDEEAYWADHEGDR